ncbi:MAG: tyrosine-type recombinase/integrase [Treponema sp.]|nr:tyrosine-type recombinase/integrase [Treponema sp.]
MAKPYLIFKAHTGIYYAQIRLADGSLSNNKSTGCRNRTEAERTVMEWIVTGNIPARVGSKDSKVKSIDKIRLFNDLRTAEFDSDDINNIIKILKERNYLYSAVASTSKGSIPIEDFLENFWDYDKSPYRQYCATLLSRTRLYWILRLAGKCVAEITRKDVDAFFSNDEAQKLAPKTINSIVETITIPLKWAYYNELTQNNCFDGIIKCSNQSKERKVIDMDTANRLMELEWDNDEAKIANELAMHTGMRAGEIQALTVDDLGNDEIFVRRSWSKYDGLRCCKNGEERAVPIPISHQLYLKLKMLADFNPHGNGFIFYSTVKDKPMDSKQFNKYLKRALAEIGYENSKGICFHFWRHFFCARMLDYVQDKRYVMALSGHKTEAMLNHYAAHLEDEKVIDLARNVMKKVFIDQKEDEETINMLNQKLEELNKEIA